MLPNADPELSAYLTNEILPRYAACDPGHREPHIRYVLRRAARFMESIPGIDPDVLAAAVCFHDLGCAVDRSRHEKISADMLRADPVLPSFLDSENIQLAAEAVEDHRASSGREPRSVYGKILSTADRNTDLDDALRRAYLFRADMIADGRVREAVEDAYGHLRAKYGPGGYARTASWLPDPGYEAMLRRAEAVTADIATFEKAFLRAAGHAGGK